MSTVCPKCGNLISDGINLCPQCGTPVAQAPQATPFQQQPGYPPQGYPQQGYPQPGYPQQPYPQQPGYPQQGYAYPVYAVPVAVAPYPQAPSQNKPDTNFGQFFSEFFKNPTDAINRRVHPSGWLFGLISLCAYVVACFLIELIEYDSDMKYYLGSKYTAASMSFCTLLSTLFSVGALVLLVMMFSAAFKIRSINFLSSLSLSGLSMIFAFPCTVISYINTKIMHALDENNKFISISSSITMITTIFLSIALFAYATQNLKPEEKRHKPVWFTICTIGCYLVCELFIHWLFSKIFFG